MKPKNSVLRAIEIRGKLLAAFAFALLLAVGGLAYWNTRRLLQMDHWVAHTHEVLTELEATLSTIKDAETGRRGYVLTGDEQQLDPYYAATSRLNLEVQNLRRLTSDDFEQQRRLDRLRPVLAKKLSHLKQSIDARKSRGLEVTAQAAWTNAGKDEMDQIRSVVGEMKEREYALLRQRTTAAEAGALKVTSVFLVGTFLGLSLLVITIYLLSHEIAERKGAEEALRKLNDELERQVAFRTKKLVETDDQLRRVNRALKTISECSQAVIRAGEEAGLLQKICDLIVAEGGYRMAWIGYADSNPAKTIRPVAQAGHEAGYLASLDLTWADSERGRSPVGVALRTGRSCIVPSILEDANFLPWREEASSRNFASVIALPLKMGEKPFGALAIYSAEPDAFDTEEVRLLQELANDLAYGVETLRTRSERQRSNEALERSESSYRSLIMGATYGILRCDAQGSFHAVNPALVKMLGYDSETELLSVNFLRDVFRDPQEGARLLHQYRQTGRVDGLEVEWTAKDCSPVPVRLSGRAMLDPQGTLEGFELIAESITERRRLEDQLRQAQKMEAVGRLAGGVAHDFNNLLTIITGYCQLLLERLDADSPLRSSLEEIQKAGDRATSLTRQLLAFSRRQVLRPQVLDMNAVVIGVEKMLRRLIGEHIDLVTVLQTGLGNVRADPGQLEQVLMNLAVNAADAMPQGGKLTLETANVELDRNYARQHIVLTPGPYVMLAVSDTGVGMDAEIQAHIFEPFFTTKEKGKGTGLGLATVYGIIKQSGGYIWVYSEPGQGASFKIYLPRVDQPVEATEPRDAAQARPKGFETVLVVEDDEAVRPLIRGILKSHGYNVLEAGRGDDAVATCQNHSGPIHLLLTDMVMPGMSGRDLANRLTSLHPELKVLYMSGYTDTGIVHQGVLETDASFLQKPFTPEVLARKVREVLDSR